jgi:hypothetical protein
VIRVNLAPRSVRPPTLEEAQRLARLVAIHLEVETRCLHALSNHPGRFARCPEPECRRARSLDAATLDLRERFWIFHLRRRERRPAPQHRLEVSHG